MIKREHLKQAVDTIARQDPEIGYSLRALLESGAMDVPGPSDPPLRSGGLYFWYRQSPVAVHRTAFFTHGVDALIQPLLIRYGEMAALQTNGDPDSGKDLARAARAVHLAGLQTAVDFQVRAALDRAGCRTAGADPQTGRHLADRIRLPAGWADSGPAVAMAPIAPEPVGEEMGLVQGRLAGGQPAFFTPFPFSGPALIQAADLNLEFFHLGFLLRCLEKGEENRLFACLNQGQLAGLVYLDPGRCHSRGQMEIVYIASGRSHQDWSGSRGPAGVGTFLVAGIWLLGRTYFPRFKEIVLDAEVAARPFYDAVGFLPRRICGYAMDRPGDRLLEALVTMADNSPGLAPSVVENITGLIRRRLARLQGRRALKGTPRRQLVDLAKTCVSAQKRPELARAAVDFLMDKGKRIRESEDLLRIATTRGRIRIKTSFLPPPVAVVHDLKFCRHLDGIFHMDGARRIQAVEAALHHPDLAGKWLAVEARPATEEELLRVHTPAHVEAVARTRLSRVTSLDADTQATALSFDTASLAAGSVMEMIDRVWSGEHPRAMAFVRPPGHHAEPDKAMGFCLFNNVAIGAHHLLACHGARRVLIVDIDAHHGNGTQTAFYDDDRVLFFSMHRFPGYPGTGNLSETGRGAGTGFTVNVPLPGGLGDRDLIQVIRHLVLPLSRVWQPEIILVSCGFDLHRFDRLGGMQASSRCYGQMASLLIEAAEACGHGRIAFVLEGGYNVLSMESCTRAVMQSLCAPVGTDRTRNRRPTLGALTKALAVQKKFWPDLSS